MKQIMRTLLIGALLFVLTAGSCFADSENIVKEYTFTAYDKDFQYDAPKEIQEKGKKYKLKGIKRYEVLAERVYLSRDFMYEKLTEQKVPKKKTFTVDGQAVQLALDQENLTFTPNTQTRIVSYGNYTDIPSIPQSVRLDVSGKEVDATLLSADKNQTTRKEPFTASGKFIGQAGSEYTFEGVPIKLKGSTPVWEGYETAILKNLGLNPKTHTLTSGKWTSRYKVEDGKTVRYAQFSGSRTRPVYNYAATYQYTLYAAKATYSNGLAPGTEEYSVKAYAEYEPSGMSTIQKILTGAGILLLAGLLVLVLMAMRRRRKEKGVR